MTPLTIRMKADGSAEILLYGTIGNDFFGDGISAKEFRSQVKAVKAKTLNLRINSPGGSVFEGSAMMQALDEFPGRVEVDVDGLAASAASVIAMAGDEVRMAPAALMMIHNPSVMTVGDAEDLRAMAEVLDKSKSQMLDAYMRKCTMSMDDLSKCMDAETWFTGQEAVDCGLADCVTEPRAVAACAGLKEVAAKLKFRHVPDALVNPPRDEKLWAETERRRALVANL